MSSRKILAVIFEPWDAQIMQSVLKNLRNHSDVSKLLIGDLWHVERPRAFEKLVSDSEFSKDDTIFLVSSPWCFRREIYRDSRRGLIDLQKEISTIFPDQDVHRLIRSDHIFSHEERRPYYYQMTEAQKASVFLFFSNRIQTIFIEFQPTDVLMIGHNYLAKNLSAEFARQFGARTWVVAPARVDRFIWATTFWPTNDGHFLVDFEELGEKNSTCPDPGGSVSALYEAQSALDLKALDADQPSDFGAISTLFDLARIARNIFSKGHRRSRAAAISSILFRVYSSSRVRATTYSVLRLIRILRFRRSPTKKWFAEAPASSGYLLIPLHTRPESSSLTFGFGSREEEMIAEIRKVLQTLSWNCPVYALENPSSIGDKRTEIYQECLRNNVSILSPKEDTHLLIEGAAAVIGLSGTALLEADLARIPAFCFGKPEFAPMLASHGHSLESFLQTVKAGIPLPFGRSELFLSWIRQHGIEADLSWKGVASTTKRRSNSSAVIEALNQAGWLTVLQSTEAEEA